MSDQRARDAMAADERRRLTENARAESRAFGQTRAHGEDIGRADAALVVEAFAKEVERGEDDTPAGACAVVAKKLREAARRIREGT